MMILIDSITALFLSAVLTTLCTGFFATQSTFLDFIKHVQSHVIPQECVFSVINEAHVETCKHPFLFIVQ